ncbi:hypothetical protein BKA66DRAFT_427252 [Pyrenochaeta sp. MPI-SDFR-AT-0127]|nr:hypothetical protein BKA66DRAFT_427252 [Pyrenochaeta sp. MPI-SDFR-AT-0127]
MPEAGLNRKSQNDATKSIQPSLLEERRAWVRQDREAKLDIFLSLAEEVMQEVFEVGPPLPPSNLNAKELLDALDKRFTVFKFETYHHAFCHFLNLHIDQYITVEDFNTEFSATLEDLLDYGQPLSNIQACSAYFSKLRCTQNPWVAKQLESWHTQSSEPELVDLLRSSPPWSCVRPLITKSSQNFHVESISEIPEEPLGDGSIDSDSDSTSERSNVSTMSSKISHSRHVSSTTAHSQEITIHASSEDIAEIDRLDHCRDLEALPTSTIQEYPSSKDLIPETPTPNHQRQRKPQQLAHPVPWPSTPDVPQRPHSSRAAFPMKQAQLSTQQHETVVPQHNQVFPELSPLLLPQLNRVGSTNSSIISLPLQGTRDSAWDYLYERKNAPREHSNQCSSPPEDKPLSKEKGSKLHAKSSSLDFVARLGGDGVVELSEEARERELAKKQRKKRSWSVNVNLSRFSTSKGVKEII